MTNRICLVFMLLLLTSGWYAQPWVYDFGSVTGSFTSSGSESTQFLPAPPSGTARVKVPPSGGGGFHLQKPGLTNLGSDTELRINAPSSYYALKFSVYDYAPGKQGYIQFDMLMGSSSGGYANTGEYYFILGNGTMFTSNNAYTPVGDVFTGLKWTLGMNGSISSTYRNSANWLALGSTPFVQSNMYRVEIYANNGDTTAGYDKNGLSFSLPINTQDIWINGVRIGENLAKAQLGDNTDIDSFLFYGISSTSSVANLFLDNIVYANSLPTCPTVQASDISLSDLQDNQVTINWTGGSGDKRVVIVSTTENIIDPFDGTDPVANPVFSAKGQQVVYNGSGNSVTVNNLSSETNYWIKVYEVSGSGLTTRYNTSALSGNYTDIESETLPVELSSFTAVVNSSGAVQLNWVTQSETNAYGYYVLRNITCDPESAMLVSPMIRATNTSTMQVYQFTDDNVSDLGTYFYWLQSLDLDGTITLHGPITCFYDPEFQQNNPSIPVQSGINTIYPNPFNPSTTISFGVKTTGDIKLFIYNIKGQLVKSFRHYSPQPGLINQSWDGCDNNGKTCASGVYTVVLKCSGATHTRKVVLMK